MDIETWINAKAEEYGYRPHTPEDTKKLLHALLAEIEKKVMKLPANRNPDKTEKNPHHYWEICRGDVLSLLRPSEPKGEESLLEKEDREEYAQALEDEAGELNKTHHY